MYCSAGKIDMLSTEVFFLQKGTVYCSKQLTMKCQAIGTFELSLKNCWLGKKTRVTSVVLITCVCIKRVEFRETVRIFPQGQTKLSLSRGCQYRRGGGGGVSQKIFIRGGSAPRSNPLPFYIPFFTKKVPLSYSFYWKMVPFSDTMFRTLQPF